MRKWLHRALGFLAGALVLVALEKAGARAMLARLRPRTVRDATVLRRVRMRLARAARNPTMLTVRVERGCVDLRGLVHTRERARVVRAVARVGGVDSVIDLMSESPTRATTSR